MTEFDLRSAQEFQDHVITRVREIEQVLDREVIAYYQADRVDDEQDAGENLRGLHNYLKRIYRDLDVLLTEIEKRPEYH